MKRNREKMRKSATSDLCECVSIHVCVCVCVREKERERVCVCECVQDVVYIW